MQQNSYSAISSIINYRIILTRELSGLDIEFDNKGLVDLYIGMATVILFL